MQRPKMRMKKLLSIAILALISSSAICGNGGEFWSNQQIYTSGTEPHAATHFTYPDESSALAAEYDKSPYFKSLCGDWRFSWTESTESRPTDFYEPTFDDKSWATIPVPSCWERHGYGVPSHRGYESEVTKVPNIPSYNPTGSYRTTFTLPEGWESRQTFINFDGVSSAFYIWVNGEMVGYDEDSFTGSMFNITKYLHAGENSLAVQVVRWSTGSYLESGDTWTFSGIFRRVYLQSRPSVQIRDLFLTSDLDADYRDAEFSAKVKVFNNSDATIQKYHVKVAIYDASGELISEPNLKTNAVGWKMGRAGTESVLSCSTKVEAPKLWSAENPYLYNVVLSLVDPEGKIVESTQSNFGFREIEIKDLKVCVNGKPTLIKGANRGETDPKLGKTLTEESMIQDLTIMKRNNFNAVRSSHHPNDPRWYALCDKYGIYVMDEALESSDQSIRANVLPGSDVSWMAPSLDRVVAMVERAKNHPSIIFWSLGNESGWGLNFALMSDYIRRFDPTRPISYDGRETDCWSEKDYFDLNSSMYPFIEDVKKMDHWKSLKWWGTPRYNKPYIMIEYAHAQGNSLGSFCEYWRVVDQNPSFVGGYIWDWVNQTYDVEMENGEIRQSHKLDYHKIDGVTVESDFSKVARPNPACAKGVVFADRTEKPSMQEVKKAHQFITVSAKGDGKYEVKNRYNETNLSAFKGSWRVLKNGVQVAKGSLEEQNVDGGSSAEFAIANPKMDRTSEYTLQLSYALKESTIWAESGFVVASEEFVLRAGEFKEPARSGKVTISDMGEKINLSGRNFTVIFDKSSGVISSIKRSGREIIAQSGEIHGPELNVYRSPIENDKHYVKGWRDAELRDLKRELISINYRSLESGVGEVITKIKLSSKAGSFEYDTSYEISGDGAITLRGKLSPSGFEELLGLPRVGVKMALVGGMEQVSWYGRGPHENYPDRNESAFLGQYSSTPSKLFTPYLVPQECGARSDVRWVELGVKGSKKSSFRVTSNEPFLFSALHYDSRDLDSEIRTEYLTERAETILSLDAKMMGVGNASCGPNPLERYTLPLQEYEFEFTFEL